MELLGAHFYNQCKLLVAASHKLNFMMKLRIIIKKINTFLTIKDNILGYKVIFFFFFYNNDKYNNSKAKQINIQQCPEDNILCALTGEMKILIT